MTGLTDDATREELERTDRRFRAYVENASDVLAIVDERGVFRYISPAVEAMLGKPPEVFEGENVFTSFVHPDDASGAMETFAATITDPDEDARDTHAFRIGTGDGDWTWVETTLSNRKTDEGYVTVTRDISGRKRSERELRDTIRVLESVLDLNSAGIFVKDSEGRYVLINDVARGMFGLEETAYEDMTDHDFMPAETARRIEEADREVLEAGTMRTFEEEIVTRDGARTFLTMKAPIAYGDGDEPGVCGVAIDVTERRERETAMEKSEERLSMALEAADAGVWDWEPASNEMTWDDSLKRLFAIEDGDIEETYGAFAERIHPEDRERVEETVSSAVERRGSFTDEFRVVRDDGEERWLRSAGQVIADGTDGGVRVTGIALDVTERREREDRLARSEERLSMALETADAGVWEWDHVTDDAHLDPALEHLFGVAHGTFDGTMQGALERVHPTDRERIETALETAVEHHTRFTVEARILRADGGTRWLMATGRALTHADGTLDRVLGVAIDVTDRKERETQLRVTDRLLRHNIRNDMNVIQGYAETLREETADDRMRSYAQRIVTTVHALLAKAEKEREIIEVLTEEPSIGDEDVAALVRRAVERQREEHPDATIVLDGRDVVRGLVSERFGEAVTELLSNAVRHSDRDDPSVTVTVENRGDTVAVRVADDGPGIPAKNVAVLSDENETPLEHGSGVGLWLVHWIVRRSDGTLVFEENEPRGTVATVAVPSGTEPGDAPTSHAHDGTRSDNQ